MVDSEDEADYTHMDSKLGKSRTEFNTEEEWQVRTAGAPENILQSACCLPGITVRD